MRSDAADLQVGSTAGRVNDSHTSGSERCGQQFGYTCACLYLDNFQLRIGEARESALNGIPHLLDGHPKASSARSALDMVQLLRSEVAG